MRVKIRRQQFPGAEPYWQEYTYEGDLNVSVAAVLDSINSMDNMDIVSWECSCLQAMCGACAMVINGVPRLACDTFINKLKGSELVIEPLRKFPVIKDLVVDRGIIQENLKKASTYIGEYEHDDKYSQELEYLIGRCLKCGLCLDACPNYTKGDNFFGPLFADDSYFINARSKGDKDAIKKNYDQHFAKGCSKALACEKVCPMNIPTISAIARMNRL